MKYGKLLMIIFAACLLGGCATRQAVEGQVSSVVEAACGECMFGMKGSDCDLAVRMNGHSYFVDGVNMDSLGDAHAKDGMCKAIRKARVTGQVKEDRFVATSFELIPAVSR